MTEVQVDELCTSTVKSTPIIRPTTGFDRSSLLWNTEPGKEKNERKVNTDIWAIEQKTRKLQLSR